MADRFKDLNVNTSYRKQKDKNNNGTRENIFKSSQSQNSQKREVTGKTLEQLAQETNNRPSGKYQHKYRERGNNDNRKKMFSKSKNRENVKPKEEFKIETSEFPELVKYVQKEEITENNYIDKVNKVEKESINTEPTLPKGWINLSLVKQIPKREKDCTENEISPYYNPALSKKILDDRLKYREELNELLGDISPYWNMVYPEDLDDSENYNDSDEESEEEEEYVEDW